MKKALLCALAGLFVLLAGCSTRRKAMPTCFYSLEGKDSVLLEKHSLSAGTLRVLVVNMSSDSLKLTDVHDLEEQEQVADFASSIHSSNGSSVVSGTNYQKSTFSGKVRDRLWTDYLLMRIAESLNRQTDAKVQIAGTEHKNLTSVQLSALVKRDSINLVIAVDSTFFTVRQQTEWNIQHLDNGMADENVIHFHNYDHLDRDLSVLCHSFWSLYWMDASTGAVTRLQRVLQTGEYYENYEDDAMKGLILCAMKTGDEFVKLFR